MSRKSKSTKAQKAKRTSHKHKVRHGSHRSGVTAQRNRRNRDALHLVGDQEIMYGLVVGRKGPVYLVEWTQRQVLIDLEILTEDELQESNQAEINHPLQEYTTPTNVPLRIGEQVTCIAAKGRGKSAVVGDYVQFIWESNDLAEGVIVELQTRDNALVRLDALGRRPQTLAANLDRIWIVCAVEPPLKSGLVDRYLVAAHAQGIAAGLVFNKIDLVMDDEHWEEIEDSFAPYRALNIPVIFTSAHHIDGMDELSRALKAQRSVFVGHSGVGKTSLLNALIPGLTEEVNQLSEATGKGQHTTTSSTLYRLTHGGEIIDSPGIRAFGLWNIPAKELKQHFVEFLEWSPYCQFHNCSHTVEPKCAVIQAMEDDHISFERYDAYLRIYEDLLMQEEGK